MQNEVAENRSLDQIPREMRIRSLRAIVSRSLAVIFISWRMRILINIRDVREYAYEEKFKLFN